MGQSVSVPAIWSVGGAAGSRQSPGSGFTRQPTRDKQMARRPVSILPRSKGSMRQRRLSKEGEEEQEEEEGGGGDGGGSAGGGGRAAAGRRAVGQQRRALVTAAVATMYFK